jgi:hypothetical protein
MHELGMGEERDDKPEEREGGRRVRAEALTREPIHSLKHLSAPTMSNSRPVL